MNKTWRWPTTETYHRTPGFCETHSQNESACVCMYAIEGVDVSTGQRPPRPLGLTAAEHPRTHPQPPCQWISIPVAHFFRTYYQDFFRPMTNSLHGSPTSKECLNKRFAPNPEKLLKSPYIVVLQILQNFKSNLFMSESLLPCRVVYTFIAASGYSNKL